MFTLLSILSLSLVTSYKLISHFNHGRISTKLHLNQLMNRDFSDVPLSSEVSELPNTFQDAVERAASITINCFSTGTTRCRIDFDTTVGDMTYTSLKNTLPMVKELVTQLATKLELTTTISTVGSNSSDSNTLQKEFYDEVMNANQKGTIRLFFPDMGAAALARRDWKMGTPVSEVPHCVLNSNIQNDPIGPTDKVIIILCPLYSETEYVKRLLDLAAVNDTPCIMINPELINMDQGFGVKARMIRNNILNLFTTSYKLRTLPAGALVREYPRGYSVWCEDEFSEDGYKLLQTYAVDPPREAVNILFDEANPPSLQQKNNNNNKPNVASAVVTEITSFFKGLSRL